jgi:energy-coupling factor transport system ATP-binding protein
LENEIVIEHFWWQYEQSKDWVLKDINLKVKPGEFIVITGPNDQGKSTLCLTMNGCIPNSFNGKIKGKVVTAGMNTQEHSTKEFSSIVGMVFQDFEAQLVTMNVEDEISFGLENLALPPEEITERIHWALQLVKMEEYLDKPPKELSGGQKQRVVIAAALAMKPKIMVLDEPTSQLDPIGKAEVYSVIDRMRQDRDLTIIVAEHRMEFVAHLADKFVLLNDGKIILEGPPKEFFSDLSFLEEKGVKSPQVTEISDYAQKNCRHKPDEPFLTVNQAYNWIVKNLGKST